MNGQGIEINVAIGGKVVLGGLLCVLPSSPGVLDEPVVHPPLGAVPHDSHLVRAATIEYSGTHLVVQVVLAVGVSGLLTTPGTPSKMLSWSCQIDRTCAIITVYNKLNYKPLFV